MKTKTVASKQFFAPAGATAPQEAVWSQINEWLRSADTSTAIIAIESTPATLPGGSSGALVWHTTEAPESALQGTTDTSGDVAGAGLDERERAALVAVSDAMVRIRWLASQRNSDVLTQIHDLAHACHNIPAHCAKSKVERSAESAIFDGFVSELAEVHKQHGIPM